MILPAKAFSFPWLRASAPRWGIMDCGAEGSI